MNVGPHDLMRPFSLEIVFAFGVYKTEKMCYNTLAMKRGVAQFGRAPRSGRGSRKFESCHLDQ